MKCQPQERLGKNIVLTDPDLIEREHEQTVTALEDAVFQVDLLTEERNRALEMAAEYQCAYRRGLSAQASLTEQLGQRDALIRDQQRQITELQQRLYDLQEEARAGHGAALQTLVEALAVVEGLPATAEELEEMYRALHVANERLVLALRGAQAGTWDWDMAENRTVWSEECLELHGLGSNPVSASCDAWCEAVHPEDRALAERFIQDWPEHRKGNVDLEYRINHPDKGLRWVALRGRIFYDRRGRACHMMGLAIDITERKQAEAQAQLARVEAERAKAAKSRFLAAASHDIRQPIQAAALFLSLLERRDLDLPTRDLVYRLADAVGGVQVMLEGLLELARLEACIIVPEVRDFSLDDLMRDMVAEFGAKAETSGLWLRMPPTGLVIASDAALLGRILRNLLANGLQYTAHGGVTVHCQEVGGMARIAVSDTGCGIPAEHLEAIFEEFRQLDNPARDRSRGFGLGLAIAAQAAGRLGHTIAVYSVPGEGSAFSVTVPLGRSAGSVASPPARTEGAETSVRLEGRRILVVEDDPAVQLALDMLLQDWGLDVSLAASLEEVEALLNELMSPPDIMLADYRLPAGGRGTEAIDMARRRWPIPAVLMTGDTAPERLAEAQRSGCRLLHKPVDPADLKLALIGCL